MTVREIAAAAMKKAGWSPPFIKDYLEGRRDAPAVTALAREVRDLRDQLPLHP